MKLDGDRNSIGNEKSEEEVVRGSDAGRTIPVHDCMDPGEARHHNKGYDSVAEPVHRNLVGV